MLETAAEPTLPYRCVLRQGHPSLARGEEMVGWLEANAGQHGEGWSVIWTGTAPSAVISLRDPAVHAAFLLTWG